MGNFRVTIEVGSPDHSRFETVEALVDTGATYTQLPESFLKDLGITPIDLRTFVVAGGQRIKRHISEAPLCIDGRVFTCPLVFMDDESYPVLGYTTLNVFGLGADSANQRLTPVEFWLPA